jgi:GT2 family glycosyltransferase
MEDFPAGPASPGSRRPPLTVVIPVHDGGRDLGRCLRGLRASTCNDFELVVVDDGSTDDSGAVAASFGARVVRHDRPRGPAAARNAGAEAATTPLVFFLDADVVPHADTLARALDRFAADPDLDALFGSYDADPTAPGVVSQFRNLLHHYVHQQGAFAGGIRPVRTFWTGCGAIRRDVFLGLGGFDPLLYRRPAIEDIELGYRLTRAGHKIVLARDVQVTHLKRWTLRSMVLTDVFHRGVPWMLLMLRSGVAEADLNVKGSQRLCVAATGLGILGLCFAPWQQRPALGLVGLAAATLVALNRDFYRFLVRRRGWRFAAAAFPMHVVYYLCCGASVAVALALHHGPSRRTPPAPRRVRADAPAPAAPNVAPNPATSRERPR